MTLYIDTHYTNLVLALLNDGKLIDQRLIESNKHSENTIPLLNKLLNDNNLTIDNIKEIIVIIGPGSFTGVRIGVVIAKTIGYAKNIPVKGISYLQAVSLNYSENVIIGLKDKNGAFIGEFNPNHELINDYLYLSNIALKDYKKAIIYDSAVNIPKIASFLKDLPPINIHELKPLYVKRIEAEK